MQLQRIWRVVITGAILVGLWWWTTVSAGADGPMRYPTAPAQPVPAGVHNTYFDACNPAAWWAFFTAELGPCTAEVGGRQPLTMPVRSGLAPR